MSPLTNWNNNTGCQTCVEPMNTEHFVLSGQAQVSWSDRVADSPDREELDD